MLCVLARLADPSVLLVEVLHAICPSVLACDEGVQHLTLTCLGCFFLVQHSAPSMRTSSKR